MDNVLSLLGLALRGGRLVMGEEPVGALCRDHKAYLLLLAQDAADNTRKRAEKFCLDRKTVLLTVPLTKAELGTALGRAECAMAALSDVGLAAAVLEKLAQTDPDTYGPARDLLAQKAQKTQRRRKAKKTTGKKPAKDK